MAIVIRESDIARMVAQQPENNSHARRYFSKVDLHPSTLIAMSKIKKETGNIPVVGRGGPGIRPKHGAEQEFVSPVPIEIDDTFSAVELDEYERLDGTGKQQLVDERTAEHFVQVRETTNALCCQALRGKIDYMMKTAGGRSRYVVDYGTVKTVNLGSLKGLTFNKAVQSLSNIAKIVKRKVGGGIEFIAADDVYAYFVELLSKNDALSQNNKGDYLLIGQYKVYQDNDLYFDADEDGKMVEKSLCNPGEILCRAVNAGQSLKFCKLDDTVMNRAVAFYSFTHDRSDHRGTDIFSKSKPFPLVNVKGLAWGKFSSTQYTLTFTSDGNGTVKATVNGAAVESGAKVNDGETVIFTLEPKDGYEFDKWSGESEKNIVSNDNGTFGIVVDADKTVKASFKASS